MYTLTRRHVLMTAAGSALTLCPAILNASVELDAWETLPDDTPVGYDKLMSVEAGPATVEISDLMPGDVAVIARPTDDPEYAATGMIQYIAVHVRTDEQIAFGAENDPAGATQDQRFFVVNLVCTHRGKAIGITGDPSAPFACLDRGRRHSSVYNASGLGIGGASEGDQLSIPAYTIADADGLITLEIA
ncbi:MAG: hypothetical protein AAFQ36_13550 [Pseudomonadota bacterium]